MTKEESVRDVSDWVRVEVVRTTNALVFYRKV